MRNPTSLILLITTTCIFCSCKKDGISPNEGTVLLQVKSSKDNGSVYKRNYVRDASDNLLKFRDSSSAGWNEMVSFDYGNDGQISRANFYEGQTNILFHYEFEYDANGRVSKRQDRPGTINLADDFHKYAYDMAGRLVADSVYSNQGPATHLSHVSKFIYTGDNITEAEYYHYYTGQAVLDSRRKFEYDEGFNPFKNLDNFYFITTISSGVDDIRYVSANNVVKEYRAEGNQAYQLVQTYKYQYNSSNYPWKYKVDVDNPFDDFVEAEFFYKQ
jgi:hypothetical protein